MKRLKILVWQAHSHYLYYLGQAPHMFYVPVKPGHPPDYPGLDAAMPWPENIVEIPAEQVRELHIDCVIFQRPEHYFREQYRILSEAQRETAGKIYLELNPPQGHPTNTRHFINNPGVLLVHVTPYNELMWDSGATPTAVIDYGVCIPDGCAYSGEKNCGICAVNNLQERGRRLGSDIYLRVRRNIPLDLIGLGSEKIEGGLGKIGHDTVASFTSAYRFFFNPARYASLGLAVCEAMMLGMPVIGLAIAEMSRVIENGVSGYVDTNVSALIGRMLRLLETPALARRLGDGAREYALRRFNIRRFIDDWNNALCLVTGESIATYSIIGNTRPDGFKEYL